MNLTRLSTEKATREGFVPIAGPFRPDTETDLLIHALENLHGAAIRIVVEHSPKPMDFTGISIWRHKSEVRMP
tara:strand:- start:1342 stop:1560 length:219 start_codon:yes stop_codon:yes gene_type:complete